MFEAGVEGGAIRALLYDAHHHLVPFDDVRVLQRHWEPHLQLYNIINVRLLINYILGII